MGQRLYLGGVFIFMSKDTFYFSHDYNTRSDSKIKKLMSIHGWLGYGIFWAIIEDLYQNANALPLHYDSIAYDMRTTPDIIKSIVLDFELFVINGDFFSSKSVQERLDKRNSKSIKAKESAEKRWNKYERNANALPTQSDSNAIKESKVKENKVKENKVKESKIKKKEFIIPAISEVATFFEENGYTIQAAEKAFNYYADGNWTDRDGKQVVNWKQKMRANWFKPENLKKTSQSKMVW